VDADLPATAVDADMQPTEVTEEMLRRICTAIADHESLSA